MTPRPLYMEHPRGYPARSSTFFHRNTAELIAGFPRVRGVECFRVGHSPGAMTRSLPFRKVEVFEVLPRPASTESRR